MKTTNKTEVLLQELLQSGLSELNVISAIEKALKELSKEKVIIIYGDMQFGIDYAEVWSIHHVDYVDADKATEIAEENINKGLYDSYLIPEQYKHPIHLLGY